MVGSIHPIGSSLSVEQTGRLPFALNAQAHDLHMGIIYMLTIYIVNS